MGKWKVESGKWEVDERRRAEKSGEKGEEEEEEEEEAVDFLITYLVYKREASFRDGLG